MNTRSYLETLVSDSQTLSVIAIVRDAWAKTLSAPCEENETWEEAGGDSLASLHLLLYLEKALGRKLTFDMLQPDMTAATLAKAIASTRTNGDNNPVPTVFLLPGILGDEPRLADFRRAFNGRIRFEVIDHPELGASAAVLGDMAATGILAAREIERLYIAGEVMLAGYSFGGSVAFEAAKVLSASGRHVVFLGILDTAFAVSRRSASSAKRFFGHSLDRLARAVWWRATKPDSVRRVILAAIRFFLPGRSFIIRRELLFHFRTNATNRWRPAPLDVQTLLAVGEQVAPSTVEKWKELCPRIQTANLPNRHVDLFKDASLKILTPIFETAVYAARDRAPLHIIKI